MLKNDIVDGTLKDFGRDVIKQARNQLTRKGKNSSSELYKSLSYNLKVSENSFFMEFKSKNSHVLGSISMDKMFLDFGNVIF